MPRHNVGHFKRERARAHFLSVYQTAMAQLPPVSESADVPTSFGTIRAHRFDGPSAGPPVVLLPGRNASTPMWRVNIPALLEHRTVIGIDPLGEAGMSVQDKPITGPDDEAQWRDRRAGRPRIGWGAPDGVSIGGCTAVNYGVRRPGRAASLTLLDPVFTFARPGQDASGVNGIVHACAGSGAAQGIQLDIGRSRGRRLAARGRADLRRIHRLRHAKGDAEIIHRSPVAVARLSAVGATVGAFWDDVDGA